MTVRIGTAGWSIPRSCAGRMPGEGTHLQRYGARLNCAEINSSFHRPHRAATYARWAASVPEDFRFAVKLPKHITHTLRLADCEAALAGFAEQVAGLGAKRGPVLVQLPPSLGYAPEIVAPALDALQALLPGHVAIEPRHPGWFAPEIDAMLARRRIARVAADPPVPAGAGDPGGWPGLRYHRLHGSPRTYWSAYDADAIADQAQRIASEPGEVWTIYDNTASGAALANALDLIARL
jgi:uncharacterized protein YecE (DUF72 family)